MNASWRGAGSSEWTAAHGGYEIHQRQPGFEFTPITLAKIASYIVRGPENHIAVFAFSYLPLAALDDEPIDEEQLLAQAVEAIIARLDQGTVVDQHDYTFRHHNGGFVEVADPSWWIKTFP